MFPGEITRHRDPLGAAGRGGQRIQPGTGPVPVRSDQPARVHRALPHPGPRRQRVHEAVPGRSSSGRRGSRWPTMSDGEGATGGGSCRRIGSRSSSACASVLLIAAAGAVVVARDDRRARPGRRRRRSATPARCTRRCARRVPANVRSAGWRWSASAFVPGAVKPYLRGGGHGRPARDRQRQEAQHRRLRPAALAAARAARAARPGLGRPTTARSPRSSTTIRSRRWPRRAGDLPPAATRAARAVRGAPDGRRARRLGSIDVARPLPRGAAARAAPPRRARRMAGGRAAAAPGAGASRPPRCCSRPRGRTCSPGPGTATPS